ncbi:hypothetical protein, partial [Enterococcus faecalis]|uniref:hypothetical protein n=1 Tax=Enterococcus faecalis TaxID=1351 RepID=UPI00403F3792
SRWLPAADDGRLAPSQQPWMPAGDRVANEHVVETHSRAQTIADAVAVTMRREDAGGFLNLHRTGSSDAASRTPERMVGGDPAADRPETLGAT